VVGAWKCKSSWAITGLEAELAKGGTRVMIRLRKGDLEQHEGLLRELIHQVVKEKTEG
jgi:hypothetical protein